MSAEGLHAAQEKMRAGGQHEEAVQAFTRAYERLAEGESAVIPSAEIEPAQSVPMLAELPQVDGPQALERVERPAVHRLCGRGTV